VLLECDGIAPQIRRIDAQLPFTPRFDRFAAETLAEGVDGLAKLGSRRFLGKLRPEQPYDLVAPPKPVCRFEREVGEQRQALGRPHIGIVRFRSGTAKLRGSENAQFKRGNRQFRKKVSLGTAKVRLWNGGSSKYAHHPNNKTMNRPQPYRPPRRTAALAIAVGTVLLVLIGFLYVRRSDARMWTIGSGDTPRIIVGPFSATAPPKGWSADAFADSLAARLNVVGAVDATSRNKRERTADFVVEGDTRAEGNQMVVALRVRPANQRAAIWNATFWRSSLADPALPNDLAVAVADALNRKKPSAHDSAAHDPKEKQ
jgi:TolB-like protein